MSILQVTGVSKSFGGVAAIQNLSLAVEAGELRCIIGPNGAGKSTLFGLIGGTLEPDRGEIVFKGQNMKGLNTARRNRAGIGRKFQAPTIFDTLTVVENLQVASHGGDSLWKLTRPVARAPLIEEILDKVELRAKGHAQAYTLSHGEKQWLEIGMVLAGRPSLILLDEPTAGMTPAETHRTSQLIKSIARDVTIIVIEHDLKFIREIARIVTVLHHGSVLAEGPIDEISGDERVRAAYLGTKAL